MALIEMCPGSEWTSRQPFYGYPLKHIAFASADAVISGRRPTENIETLPRGRVLGAVR